ncbi:hypothetical protein CIB84_000467 [Bambusicola thoracicus]|uniref:Uncharacterized protein n=1 Tax=Bambusicola thoracicus TaxID=9083 RepID=A0A2P4THD8_BAMTH|nr:hypothetical protein CIB84_000467 [Bambusicola thoracicus]
MYHESLVRDSSSGKAFVFKPEMLQEGKSHCCSAFGSMLGGYHHSWESHTVVFSSFVLVNSVAMEGDGCSLCRTAEAKLVALSHRLNCSQQHYPLYRKSDAECSGEDAAPPEEKTIPFKEKYDVLSQEASQKGSITPTDFSLHKCFLPRESRVFAIYWAAGALLVVLVLAHFQLLTPPFYFAQRLISKHKAA